MKESARRALEWSSRMFGGTKASKLFEPSSMFSCEEEDIVLILRGSKDRVLIEMQPAVGRELGNQCRYLILIVGPSRRPSYSESRFIRIGGLRGSV